MVLDSLSRFALASFFMLLSPCVFAATANETALRETIRQMDDAFNAHNSERFLSFYVPDPDSIYFEAEKSLQIKGIDGMKQYAKTLMDPRWQMYQHTTIESLAVDQRLAVIVCIQKAGWIDPDKKIEQTQMGRFTYVLKKVDGRWLVWHEHNSLPDDYETGKAIFDAKP